MDYKILSKLKVKDIQENMTLSEISTVKNIFTEATNTLIDGHFYAVRVEEKNLTATSSYNYYFPNHVSAMECYLHKSEVMGSADLFTNNTELVDMYSETEYSRDITFVGSEAVFQDMEARGTLSELQAWRFPKKS